MRFPLEPSASVTYQPCPATRLDGLCYPHAAGLEVNRPAGAGTENRLSGAVGVRATRRNGHVAATRCHACLSGTFNTINKWAYGLADTLALALLTEAVGLGLPLVAAPALNNAQAAHPAFDRSIAALREMGVTVLYGPDIYEPGPPGAGGRLYDWELPLEALEERWRGTDGD